MGLLSKLKETKSSKNDQAKVIAFINQKGGVGKTTMAFNVAHALKCKNKKVLCLDLDPQANLSLLLGDSLDSENNIFQLMINSIRELKALHKPLLVSDVIKSSEGVDYIPSTQMLSGFELSVAGISSARPLILKNFLLKSGLSDIYDYILIDGPPTLGLLVVNILCASNGVMVPFRPDDFSKKGLEHFYDVLEDVEDMGIVTAPKVLAHIPNLVDTRRKQEVADLEDIKNKFNTPVVNPFINRAMLVKSQSQKKSVFSYNSKEFNELKDKFIELADIIERA